MQISKIRMYMFLWCVYLTHTQTYTHARTYTPTPKWASTVIISNNGFSTWFIMNVFSFPNIHIIIIVRTRSDSFIQRHIFFKSIWKYLYYWTWRCRLFSIFYHCKYHYELLLSCPSASVGKFSEVISRIPYLFLRNWQWSWRSGQWGLEIWLPTYLRKFSLG